MKTLALFLMAALLLPFPFVQRASATTGDVRVSDYMIGAWFAYRLKFVEDSGRVVDNVNGNISHSESQGYAMVLAVSADDRETFDRIWSWTRENLFIREDRLAAWKWDPEADPPVQDMNNATDGDLLIAWALMKARMAWGEERYLAAAREILEDIRKLAVVDTPHGKILLPGVIGFDAESQESGPIVNLSYWIFPAIDELGLISPEFPARELIATGLKLLEKAKFGPSGLPANWIALGGEEIAPAPGFDTHFGYDAIRIPLYLAWLTASYPDLLEPYERAWTKRNGRAVHVIDLESGEAIGAMTDPGYQAIVDLVLCSRGTQASAFHIRRFEPTDYYPSTLHLLSLLAMVQRYPQCLTAPL